MQLTFEEIKHFKYFMHERRQHELEDVVFDDNGYVESAFVLNGYWSMKWVGDSYNYGGKDKVHYSELTIYKKHDEEVLCGSPEHREYLTVPMSNEEIQHVLKEKAYPYQPKKTLTDTLNEYKNCLVNGTEENANYLFQRLSIMAKQSDETNNFLTTSSVF